MLLQQSKTKEIESNGINLKRGFRSAIVGFVLTILIFLFASLLIYISVLPEESSKAIVILTTILASFSAGYLTSKNVPMYGLLNGIVSGVLYFLILYISNMLILADFSFNTNIFLILLIVLIGSALGGIIGINVRANRRSRRKR